MASARMTHLARTVAVSSLATALDPYATLGCSTQIEAKAVHLEPHCAEITAGIILTPLQQEPYRPKFLNYQQNYTCLRICLNRRDPFTPANAELFLNYLGHTSSNLAFEVQGNSAGICLTLAVPKDSAGHATSVFQSLFPASICQPADDVLEACRGLKLYRLYDFIPRPPTWGRLCMGKDQDTCSISSIITSLASLPSRLVGLYQVLFVRTSPRNDWHSWIQRAMDGTHCLASIEAMRSGKPSQHPSLYLPSAAKEEEQKAAQERPFYAVAVRAALWGRAGIKNVPDMSQLLAGFQYGAKAFTALSLADYRRALKLTSPIRGMLLLRQALRTGMLLNSRELALIIHLPSAGLLQDPRIPLERSGYIPFLSRSQGELVLGINRAGNVGTPICVAEHECTPLMVAVGNSGSGKTTFLLSLFNELLKKDQAVVVIDPHSDLARACLRLVPRSMASRVVWLSLSDAKFIPLFNPFYSDSAGLIDRLADDMAVAQRQIVAERGWGARSENLFRHIYYALIALKLCLRHAPLFLERGARGDRFRDWAVQQLPSQEAKRFWIHDFKRFSRLEHVDPTLNKLSKLLLYQHVGKMLSQRESRINFKQLLDQKKIVLIDLGSPYIGSSVSDTLGSWILAHIDKALLSRGALAREERHPAWIIVDEVHRFTTGPVESIAVQGRKFGGRLVVATQHSKQLEGLSNIDIVGSAQALVCFQTGAQDAEHLSEELKKEVDPGELLSLDRGKAYARIAGRVCSLEVDPVEAPTVNYADLIVQASRRKYYRPAEQCTVEELPVEFQQHVAATKRKPRTWDEI